jgi:DNA-binding NarL/FixJ family response regulator
MISILILEDNATLANRLKDILMQWEFVAHVGLCSSIADANRLIDQNNWDVFLCDLGLPDGDGKESIRKYTDANPDGISIVISSKSDDTSIMSAIQSGAVGYIYKDDHSIQIVDAVKLALNGQSPISPSIAYSVVHMLANAEQSPTPRKSEPRDNGILTQREVEVLSAISKGLTYVETSEVLGISKNTVPVHIRNIYRKLQANNRSEAVFEAQNLGIKL